MELTPDDKIRAIRQLTDALFQHVLYDEEPIFVGDFATMLDVSSADPEELQKRISAYYKATVSIDESDRVFERAGV